MKSHFFILDNIDYGRNLEDIIQGCSSLKYGDLVSSEMALRHNIQNIPSEEQWKSLELLCQKIIEPLHQKGFEIVVQSAFRTPILSALMGSSTSSNHCKGIAIDFYVNEKNLSDIFGYINKNMIFHEMIAEFFPNGWIHISYKDGSRAKTLKIHDKINKNLKISSDYFN